MDGYGNEVATSAIIHTADLCVAQV